MRTKKLSGNKLNINNKKFGQKGFTLVEMMVVVVIIGILAGVVFVALSGQGKRTRVATATTSMKNALAVATTCFSLGGDIEDPGSDIQKPRTTGNPSVPIVICNGVPQFTEPAWPDFPDGCVYCGKINTTIYFECSKDACSDVPSKSSCDYASGQCVQAD